MLYILLIFILFIISVQYKQTSSRAKFIYQLLAFMTLFVMSAFQYKVGADIPAYMGEFDFYDVDFSLDYLNGFESRQPLWVLFNVFCKNIYDNFFLLKLLLALFVNLSVFKFINRHAINPITGVLVYFVFFYFHLNFNILRSSVVVAIFLLSYDYLLNKKYLKYYICSFIALLFHHSALLLFILPFAFVIKISDKNLKYYIQFLFIFAFVVLAASPFFKHQIYNLYYMLMSWGILSSGESYIQSKTYAGFSLSVYGVIEQMVIVSLYIYVLYYNVRNRLVDNPKIYSLYFLFLIIYLLNLIFPILYRFNDSLYPIYLCFLANFVFFKTNKVKRDVMVYLAWFVLFFAVHNYSMFIYDPHYGVKQLDQYYPYSSVFNKRIHPPREQAWGYKENIEYIY